MLLHFDGSPIGRWQHVDVTDEGVGDDRVVWIFHGEGAAFACGVFDSEEDGLAWAARHGVSGLLTEYPVGDGAYDIAVAVGAFVPSKPQHRSPSHVQRFSPGWTRHVHISDGEQTDGSP